MRFIHLFLAGYVVLVIGAVLAAWQLGVFSRVAPVWIIVAILAAIGIGIMMSVSAGKPAITKE